MNVRSAVFFLGPLAGLRGHRPEKTDCLAVDLNERRIGVINRPGDKQIGFRLLAPG
jgi:hypothetical protein